MLLTDAEGNSDISGEDFAIAFVDEITSPAHHRARFGVAYDAPATPHHSLRNQVPDTTPRRTTVLVSETWFP